MLFGYFTFNQKKDLANLVLTVFSLSVGKILSQKSIIYKTAGGLEMSITSRLCFKTCSSMTCGIMDLKGGVAAKVE